MYRLNKVFFPVLIILSAILSVSHAAAQESGGDSIPKYNLQRFRPAPNPGDYLMTYGTYPEEHLRPTGGIFFNYAYAPLVKEKTLGSKETEVVQSSLYADLFLSFSMFRYVEISTVFPIALFTDTSFGVEPFSRLDKASGIGDMRFLVKGKLLDITHFPLGLALVVDLNVPTGNGKKFMGDGKVGVSTHLAAEFIPVGKWRLAFNLGYRYRPTREILKYTMGQSILLSAASAVPFFHKNLDLVLDFNAEISLKHGKKLTSEEVPLEFQAGYRYRFIDGDSWARGLSMFAGVGIGSRAVGSPAVRGILGLSFHWVGGGGILMNYNLGGYIDPIAECPDVSVTPPDKIPAHCRIIDTDSDGDGIPDRLDKCPFQGKFGFVDEDGCPKDSDGDGIPDYDDECPNEGERGRVDRRGCPIAPEPAPEPEPEPQKAQIEGNKIKIDGQVFFETGKDTIKSESFALLDAVARSLKDNPQIANMVVEGHTDNVGNKKKNKKLSQDRANSVMNYLISKGVEAERLSAKGYGSEKPIDTNKTPEGRSKNRRVEFTIVD